MGPKFGNPKGASEGMFKNKVLKFEIIMSFFFPFIVLYTAKKMFYTKPSDICIYAILRSDI